MVYSCNASSGEFAFAGEEDWMAKYLDTSESSLSYLTSASTTVQSSTLPVDHVHARSPAQHSPTPREPNFVHHVALLIWAFIAWTRTTHPLPSMRVKVSPTRCSIPAQGTMRCGLIGCHPLPLPVSRTVSLRLRAVSILAAALLSSLYLRRHIARKLHPNQWLVAMVVLKPRWLLVVAEHASENKGRASSVGCLATWSSF